MKAQGESPDFLGQAPKKTECFYLPLSADQLTLLGAPPCNPFPPYLLAESHMYLPQKSGQGDHIPSVEGNSCLVSITEIPFFWADVLGEGVELASGKNDPRKDMLGACGKAFYTPKPTGHQGRVFLCDRTLPCVEAMPRSATAIW